MSFVHGDPFMQSWIAGHTISTSDNSSGSSAVWPETYTIKVAEWNVPSATVPGDAIESLVSPPVSALDRLDERLNRIRQRVAA